MAINVKEYVDYLIANKIGKEEGGSLIGSCSKLSREEKNLIYAYVYPRVLGDRELPSRVQAFRAASGIPLLGTLQPSTSEATLIVEAFRTEQYGKFIRHLIHAFSDPTKVFPLEGRETDDCCICGKMLYEKDVWDDMIRKNPGTVEEINREYLSFGSTESDVVLCSDCLVQLIHATELLEGIDPDFLSWNKGGTCKSTWDDLKL